MMKACVICGLVIFLGACLASAEDAGDGASNWDWLGIPIYTNSFWHYMPYHYVPPYYYTKPYWTYPYAAEFMPEYLAYPWWIGEHTDLPKVLEIARSSSSVRVYSNGFWQTP